MSSYIVFTALLFCYAPLHYYITPLLTSPVRVLSIDKSHSFYYKYKHRIYCGGGRNKGILIRILRLRTLPSLPLLTAALTAGILVYSAVEVLGLHKVDVRP
jgi:hypothetical protein